MKNMMKKLISILVFVLCMLCSGNLMAAEIQVAVPLNGSSTVDMYFSILSVDESTHTGTVSVGRSDRRAVMMGQAVINKSTVGSIEIPAEISDNGYVYTVVEIGQNAFIGCAGITSISIPEGVTQTGKSAFNQCSGLHTISIPASLKVLGASTFSECSNLTSVTFATGSVLESIGSGCFYKCEKMTEISLPASVTNIDGAFSYCTGLTSIEVPVGVTTVGGATFAECINLETIHFQGNITSIGTTAFYNCVKLSSVNLPNQVTEIGRYAFYNCSSIANLKVPEGMTDIGDYAFAGCSGLTRIYIGPTVTSIGEGAFSDCTATMKVIFDNCMPKIAFNSFENCSKDDKLYFPTRYYEVISGHALLSEMNLYPYMTIANEYNTFAMDAKLDITNVKVLDTEYEETDATDFHTYVCKNFDKETRNVSVDEITGVLPAREGMLVKGTQGTKYLLKISKDEATADVAGNLLRGVITNTKIGGPSSLDYVLVDGIFYRASAGTLGAGKCYLHLPSNTSAGARLNPFNLDILTTGIEDTFESAVSSKGLIYDLNGKVVGSGFDMLKQLPQGIYIYNNRKYMNK